MDIRSISVQPNSATHLEELKKERARRRLQKLLSKRPDIANKFLEKIEKKGSIKPPVPEPTHPPIPKPKPAPMPEEVKIEPLPQPAPTPLPVIETEAPKPVVTAWMTESEKSDLNSMFTILETNAMGIYACLKAFFCKQNCQPYHMHVSCIKKQLIYMQDNLIKKFPQVETPERRNLFSAFQNLANILQEAETAIIKVVDPKPTGLFNFGIKFNAIEPLLATWKKQANQILNSMRGFIQPNMLARLNKLRDAINRMFDFQKELSTLAIPGIISHRLKT
jgi:hypothetical protein